MVGDSGHNADPIVSNKKVLTQPIPINVTVDKSLLGYGYMLANVDKEKLSFEFYQVIVDTENRIVKKLFDTASVNLKGSNLGELILNS